MQTDTILPTGSPCTCSPTYAELLEFVESQLCECNDEYGNPMPQPCDRCKLLKQDKRVHKQHVPGS